MKQLLLLAIVLAGRDQLQPLPAIPPGEAASKVLSRFPQLRPYRPIDGPPDPNLLVGPMRVELNDVPFRSMTISLVNAEVRSASFEYELWQAGDAGRGRRPDRSLFDAVQRHLVSRLGEPAHRGKCLYIWVTDGPLIVHEIGRVKYQAKQEWDSLVGSKYIDPFCWEQ